jgi:hypothetical protein
MKRWSASFASGGGRLMLEVGGRIFQFRAREHSRRIGGAFILWSVKRRS